jgi:hypothetical protein
MSAETSLAGALPATAPTRERRPSVAGQAASPEGWGNAWQREMERMQAGAWFPGALPDSGGSFTARDDAPPGGLVLRALARPGAAHEAHASASVATEAGLRRAAAGEVPAERRAERESGDAARSTDVPATNVSPARAPSPDARVDEGLQPEGELPAVDSARAEAVEARAFSADVPSAEASDLVRPTQADSSDDATPGQAPSAAASPLSGSQALAAAAVTFIAATTPTDRTAAAAGLLLSATQESAAPAPKASVAASLDQATTPVRTAAAMPGMAGATAAMPSTSTAGSAMPMAQEVAGAAGAASGVRTLASIERVLATTLGGTPGPRLHLSWDGQAVTVWLGVDGAVDPAALLRTVQNVLRQQGLQLSGLVCNGRTIVQARPGQGQGQESNSEHQEN